MSDFDKPTVAHILETDEQAMERWESFCTKLIPTDAATKMTLKRGINSQNETWYSVFLKILNTWTSRNGTSVATIYVLVQHLVDLEFQESAVTVAKEFAIPVPSKTSETNSAAAAVSDASSKPSTTAPPPPTVTASAVAGKMGPFPLDKVATILSKESTLFLDKWKDLYVWLEINDSGLLNALTRKEAQNTGSAKDRYKDLLEAWKLKKGRSGTVKLLVEILIKNECLATGENLEDKCMDDDGFLRC